MRHRIAVAATGLVLVVGLLAYFALTDDEDVVAPYPSPAPTPTPTPTPSPTPAPTVPPAEPFELTFEDVQGLWLGNQVIFGEAAPELEAAALEEAAAEAGETLTAFLDAMFVDADTRFSRDAVDVLLDDRALAVLTEGEQGGLGVVVLDELAGTRTGTASARATVLVDADGPRLVTLVYEAETSAVHEGGAEVPVIQSGTVVLLPSEDGWRARSAEVTTTAEDA